MADTTPTPPDWFDLAPTLTVPEIVEHYGLARSTVRRMIKRTGITPQPAKSGPPKGTMPANRYRVARGHFSVNVRGNVETEVAEAANYLRRFYRNVFRCDIVARENPKVLWGELHDVPNKGVGYYHVDKKGILANTEVIDLAKAKGWESHT